MQRKSPDKRQGWDGEGTVGIPLKSLVPWAPSHPRSYLWVPVPGWRFPPGHPRTPRQEEGADQRAGARQGNLRCLLCLRSGEAQPETGWMGALGQRLGWGWKCQRRNQIPVYSRWTKGMTWRGGQAPLTSCSSWRLPARSWDIWVKFSSGAGKTQSGWHFAPLLVGDPDPHTKLCF